MTQAHPNRLRELRTASGLAVAQLAAEFNITSETVERYERGTYPIPTLRAQAFAIRFAVSLDHLLCHEEAAA